MFKENSYATNMVSLTNRLRKDNDRDFYIDLDASGVDYKRITIADLTRQISAVFS